MADKTELQKQLREARKAADHADREKASLQQQLSRWTLWWSWASFHAGPAAAARFNRLGSKRPRRSDDRSGPQGSQ